MCNKSQNMYFFLLVNIKQLIRIFKKNYAIEKKVSADIFTFDNKKCGNIDKFDKGF